MVHKPPSRISETEDFIALLAGVAMCNRDGLWLCHNHRMWSFKYFVLELQQFR